MFILNIFDTFHFFSHFSSVTVYWNLQIQNKIEKRSRKIKYELKNIGKKNKKDTLKENHFLSPDGIFHFYSYKKYDF